MIYPNPMVEYKNPAEKAKMFARDVAAGANAVCSQDANKALSYIPLASLDINAVEFIGGQWRVQNDFPHKITTVRDKIFVIGEHLNRHEQNMFEYYSAHLVGFNCYGPFMVDGGQIVACFRGGMSELWAYGPSIEHARAFLAISLFDRNREIIFSAERDRARAVHGK